jgi:hypothetical protein
MLSFLMRKTAYLQIHSEYIEGSNRKNKRSMLMLVAELSVEGQ